MSKPSSALYQRPHAAQLARRLKEPRRFIQVVAGPRQAGKTTLVQQVTETSGLPVRICSTAATPVRHRWPVTQIAGCVTSEIP